MTVFETPTPVQAKIDVALGHVRLVASDRADTVVEVHPTDPSARADVRAAQDTRVSCTNGRLHVKGPKVRGLAPKAGSLDITVQLPAGSELDVDAAWVTVRGEGRLGDCRVHAATGDIHFERTGDLRIRSASGEHVADAVVGHVDVNTTAAKVRLGHVDGRVTVRNSNGDTTIGEASEEVLVKGASGDVTVDQALADVTVRLANGDIRLREVVRGTVAVEAAAGNVDIGVRRGSVAWLDVNSVVGHVHNGLESSGAPTEDEEKVHIRARLVAGGIAVHHA